MPSANVELHYDVNKWQFHIIVCENVAWRPAEDGNIRCITHMPFLRSISESGLVMNRLLAVTVITFLLAVPNSMCRAQSTLVLQGNALLTPPNGFSKYGSTSGYSGHNYSGNSWGALGQYEIQHQQAVSLAIRNRASIVEENRNIHIQAEADREALKHRRADQNWNTELRHLRDAPDATHVASGETLNFLLKQLGPDLKTVDFVKVNLTADELDSVRLQTSTHITTDELESTAVSDGRVAWPEELQHTELQEQRLAVEQALKKLHGLAGRHHDIQTQLKRVRHELSVLRSEAGRILAVQKHDEIGVRASRIFLQHLESNLVQLINDDRRKQLDDALHPNIQSAGELIRHIANHDLEFAPCEDPTAPAYRKLHDQLAAAHRELHGFPQKSLQAAK